MTETDKIVAAIFAANMCRGKTVIEHLQTYDDFLNKMKEREEAKKKQMKVSKEALARATEPPPRKR
jgi:NifU-like protein involved in Fe-S cluster formation